MTSSDSPPASEATETDGATETIVYDDQVTRWFIWASIVFGIVGMSVGALVALQLAFWPANLEPYLTFGRLRPLHTNAVIFAFVGNMLFAGVYYSTQRLCKTRMASDKLSKFHFWGWQLIIVAAAVSLPLGFTQGKEYAELEWPIDIAIAVVWLAFAANFFLTLERRREKHLYVALWFYIATIVTITVLHVVNSLAIPVGGMKSYSIFGGVQDALVQWWYGHNAVAFFLTTPILGIMYYFLPKAADRPVFSYRLSIIHFWSLVFIYIWAGPHHLLYTALPDWAQTLGMIFSLMLWAPSWGGMLNGLLTLRGAWDKLRTDPVLKFFAVGVTAYGMATFEGPLLSIKSVSGLAHYTDWIIGHVHGGGLGWNGFMAAGMFYYLIPKLYGKKLHSTKAANAHFWIGTLGILVYMVSMYVAGITQGLMWRAENEGGGLMYPQFVETYLAIRPLYWARLLGGSAYLFGFVLMAWNLWKTARAGEPVETSVEVAKRPEKKAAEVPWKEIVFAPPVMVGVVALGVFALVAISQAIASIIFITIGVVLLFGALLAWQLSRRSGQPAWHHLLEGRAMIFTVLTVLAMLVGGAAELLPSILATPEQLSSTHEVPYTPLEIEGRDVYLQEGCYTCHSQMIRPFTWETARYGAVSEPDRSIYDHPFQWGSRRIGPDLARVGGKYSNTWHYRHMIDPREVTPGSNMPIYAPLASRAVDFGGTDVKLRAMRTVGVPYEADEIATAEEAAWTQARAIAESLRDDAGVRICEGEVSGDCDLRVDGQLVALISYLQRLGNRPAAPAGDESLVSQNDEGEVQ
ncbi:MAG: cytochrome-c oxidase, cbb3-type subunit I [Deltaproteobacteria bacterium]|nr:cytochrome-c oxidase, cbb3-type subunit I [Deltaproteobacteria bacterium]